MTTLRERLEARAAIALQLTRKECEHSPFWKSFNLGALSVETIVDNIDRQVVHFVDIFVDRAYRSGVLELPMLAERWPFGDAVHGPRPDNFDEEHIRMLLSIMDQTNNTEGRWPAELAPADLADALERTRDADAILVAGALRDGRFFVGNDGKLSSVRFDTDAMGKPIVMHPDSAVLAASNKWPPVGCALVVLANRIVRGAYARHTTVPRSPALALSHVRVGNISPTDTVTAILDPSGRTFPTPASGARYWRFTLTTDTQLSLPISMDHRDPFCAAREAMSGMTLRVWLATWVLASDRTATSGLFLGDLRRIILDVFGMKPAFTTSKGRLYMRPSPRDEARVKQALDDLERVMLRSFGTMTLDPPEPVIRRTTVSDTSNGRQWEVYQHSAFAWAEARRNFVQVPIAALRLDANHSDLVLGIANTLRCHASRWLKKGSLNISLEDLAREIGQPVDAGRRRDGRAYWSKLRERLSEVVTSGGFGKVRFGSGEDGDARVTLEPNDELEVVYRTLLDAIEKRKERSERVATEAEVRALLEANRRGGRPRKSRG